MIKIPAQIKSILKSDTCKKNIRVVFPNNDHQDICNDKIVKGSFSFTESICSGDSLTLGIMESPVISFECVGIQNIKGKTIKVYCEILCSSNDSADAVYMADIDSYVYQIPYGVFTVTESKRQADLEHRVVTAYASVIDDSIALRSDYLTTLNLPWYDQKIPIRVHISDIEKMNFYDVDQITDDVSLTEEEQVHHVYPSGLSAKVTVNSFYKVGSAASGGYQLEGVTNINKDFTYYKVEGNFAEYLDRCKAIEDYLVEIYKTKISASNDKVRQAIKTLFGKYIYPNRVIDVPTSFIKKVSNYSGGGSYTGGSVWGDYSSSTAKDEERKVSSEVLYSNNGCIFNALLEEFTVNTSTKKTNYYTESHNYIYIPISYSVWVQDVTSGEVYIRSIDASDIITGCKSDLDSDIYVLKSSNTSAPVDDELFRIDFNRTISNKIKRRKQTLNSNRNVTASEKQSRKEYISDLSTLSDIRNRDLMASYAELQGKIGRVNRYGKFELVKLNGSDGLTPNTWLVPKTNLYPRGANGGTYFPIQYISCWYEDLSIKKIGRINLTFNDVNNDNEKSSKSFDIVSDYNEETYCSYNIGNNWILDNCTFSEEEIDEILAEMGSNLQDIKYTPCNIEMLGRPDLESGDFIQVVTNKGECFNTIVFRRTIKGTQLLIDSIEVNASDDEESNAVGSGSSSSVSGGTGGSSAVTSVNGYTGAVNLKMSDLENDAGYIGADSLYYQYDSTTKKLSIFGIGKKDDTSTE